jgi:phosphatidylethanolamine-binding protein (PEBP) family uncharacterized protein
MLSLKRPSTLAGVSLVLVLAIAGCGSATTSSTSGTPGVRFNGKAASLQLSSQFAGSSVPNAYTCDGRNELPPLTWGEVPPGTKQMALFILGFNRSGANTQIKIRYAAAGLNPALHGMQTGQLPAGAFPGRGSSKHTKYSLCPPRGTTENYLFMVYAVPSEFHIPRNFNASQELGRLSPATSPALFGAFLAVYARP